MTWRAEGLVVFTTQEEEPSSPQADALRQLIAGTVARRDAARLHGAWRHLCAREQAARHAEATAARTAAAATLAGKVGSNANLGVAT